MSDNESMDVDHGDGDGQSRADLEAQWDKEYPNRPINHKETLPFHTLFEDLFRPLIENSGKKPTAAMANRRKVGPSAHPNLSPAEKRRVIIEKYISRWRKEVGPDFYPAFRLIIPDKDRERGVYGLKEKIIAKLLVKIMKIDKNSEDGYNILHWKQPGQNPSKMAGDFAGRCHEVISKRPMRMQVGNMTIGEVNRLLDELSAASREDDQLLILTEFYKRMNAEELMWLIRVILRQMKVGATEKTFFHLWHPDAETLFNVSSSLRRVCWELFDPEQRLQEDETAVAIMQCFQPQLAEMTQAPLPRVVEKMRPTDEDREFWIEEKLDGERMQLHMITDPDHPGGKRFRFWSRKAKDYTYLYGNGFEDKTAALTQFLRKGFADGVENIILDGEMITWDPEQKAQMPFGTLKTAAISEGRNPYTNGPRPLFRVFDILLLNGKPLTRYTLRDRRRALLASMKNVVDRFEVHEYTSATQPTEVEDLLRKVVAEDSEGLVLKNPRSAYRLNDRSSDWQKVKPEYMTEFGESLDCLIIGGFYGSGRRGGGLSSFMCGLRISQARQKSQSQRQSQAQSQSQHQVQSDEPIPKFLSFFKVGGGMTANDYATIRHETDGKWHKWDPRRAEPYIDLAGNDKSPKETPDVWIKPQDSLVVQVKAAQVTPSEDYGFGSTLRFPRFTCLRRDKDWTTALSEDDFRDLRTDVEGKRRDAQIQVDEERKKKRKARTAVTSRTKKPLTVAGFHARDVNAVGSLPQGPKGDVFGGLTFYIMTESNLPGEYKKSKLELEAVVKANGGKIVQTASPGVDEDTICVASRRTVKVASVEKRGDREIIKPIWIFDCIEQSRKDFAAGVVGQGMEMVVPYEVDRHLFFAPEEKRKAWADNVDEYGDAFGRDTGVEEVRDVMSRMKTADQDGKEEERLQTIPHLFADFLNMKGFMFLGLVFFFDDPLAQNLGRDEPRPASASSATAAAMTTTTTTRALATFASATVLPYARLADIPASSKASVTHIVAHPAASDLTSLRRDVSRWETRKIPRIVAPEWIEVCWREGTRVAEERFVAR